MEIDIPEKTLKKLRASFKRAYGKQSVGITDRSIVLTILADSLHPIDESHLTIK